MGGTTLTVGGPGEGFMVGGDEVKLIAHTGLSLGDLVAIDTTVYANSAAGDFSLTTTSAIAAEDVEHGLIAVALEDVASGAQGRFGLRGFFYCSATNALSAGEYAVADAATTALDGTASIGKIIAIAVEANAGSGATSRCIFNGIEGFGHSVA